MREAVCRFAEMAKRNIQVPLSDVMCMKLPSHFETFQIPFHIVQTVEDILTIDDHQNIIQSLIQKAKMMVMYKLAEAQKNSKEII